MSGPILDLFCCAGGAAKGYMDAGFDVVGVDINKQPNYIGSTFIQGDALSVTKELVNTFNPVMIHASPPCQGYTALKAVHRNQHPMLIEKTRDMLNTIGLPYVIENVAGAPIRKDLMLCGETFGLGVLLHRYFEISGFDTPQPVHQKHRGRVRGWRHGQYFDGPYVAVHGQGGGKATVAEAQVAKRIFWTSDYRELCEAIPPSYTEYIGRHFRDPLRLPDVNGYPPQPGPGDGAVDPLPIPRPRRPAGVGTAESRERARVLSWLRQRGRPDRTVREDERDDDLTGA